MKHAMKAFPLRFMARDEFYQLKDYSRDKVRVLAHLDISKLPKNSRIHRTDGVMDGFCWTKVHHDGNETLGEIYAVGVDPSVTSRGVGRRLVIDGLHHLAAVGASTAMLYVDSDNAAAMKVYSDLGFTSHHSELAFVGDVGAAR